MPSLPSSLLPLICSFSHLFTEASWMHAQVLITGAILCHSSRKITTILRVMGLSNERRFEKYHRILNRNKWNCLYAGRILLGLIIRILPDNWEIIVGIDETLERRYGKRINAKGCYRDAVRSSTSKVVKCFGLKWSCMALIVPLPWSTRPWALPFMTVLCHSKKANKKRGREHKTSIDIACTMVKILYRWLNRRAFILVADGAYACVHFAHICLNNGATLITRMRLDARLFDFPEPQPKGKPGPKPKKGKRAKSLREISQDKNQKWQKVEVTWYGGIKKTLCILSGVNLWHTSGEDPLPIRWVLVMDPEQKIQTQAFFSTDVKMDPVQVVEYFVMRWNIEVTFQETRAHLGVETQRQWSDKAIARTTPVLLGLYSLICLMTIELKKKLKFTPQSTAWYTKEEEACFSDIIIFVRQAIWGLKYLDKSNFNHEGVNIPADIWQAAINQLASAF